ncbi:unnamed protein product [Peronospora belbahrii]|uniref:Kinetochore protein Spc24 n=1 Tax=Peronospora belbahrii TaxID=622444 RepID=A0AAU9LG72_9STRA|nr:unnamed protein product [Peronospora belbahrii]CAH0520698.1 unnamed protein product [Peronospora belbahrii]
MMESRRVSVASTTNGLSWQEVQEICGQLEGMFHEDAPKDAQRLRALIQKRKEIANAFYNRQSSAQKLLAHLRENLNEWEEKEQKAQERNEQLHKRLQELDAFKRDMVVQLDRFRLNEQTSRESLDMLLNKYEEARQELLQFNAAHQNDVPEAKNQMSLFASVTGIRWDFSDSKVAGDIHVPAKKRIVRFEIDPSTDHFTAANSLWDKIDEAFDDIDIDL